MSLNDEVPLASLLLFLITLASVSAWTLLVMNHQGPLAIDLQAQRLFSWLTNEPLQLVSLVLAKIGDALGISALLLPLAVWLIHHKRMDALSHWAFAIGGVALLNTMGKMVFGRVRPETPDYLAGSFSYPSAHTSTAVVVAGLAAAFIAAGLHRKQRVWVYWLAIILVTPMALSRLILGVHWLSDLIGGALLGLLVCALVRLNWQRSVRTPLPRCPWGRLIAATIVLVGLRVILLPPV